MWMDKGILTRKHGDLINQEIGQGGAYLTVAGRSINQDGTLGGYFSHRRPSTIWYASEGEAMEALSSLAVQEGGLKHSVKPEVDLRRPGIIEAYAYVEPQRW